MLTLAFSGCLWLAGAAMAETSPEDIDLRGALMARFGALDWSGDDRFPMPCDEAEGEVHRAETLAGQSTPPAPFLRVEGRLVDVFEGRERWFLNFGADYQTDFTASL